MDIDSLVLTPVEKRMMRLLNDGMVHTKEELRTCLVDDLATNVANISNHIGNIRKKIRRHGHDIVCESIRGTKLGYRHVRLLRDSDD